MGRFKIFKDQKVGYFGEKHVFDFEMERGPKSAGYVPSFTFFKGHFKEPLVNTFIGILYWFSTVSKI